MLSELIEIGAGIFGTGALGWFMRDTFGPSDKTKNNKEQRVEHPDWLVESTEEAMKEQHPYRSASTSTPAPAPAPDIKVVAPLQPRMKYKSITDKDGSWFPCSKCMWMNRISDKFPHPTYCNCDGTEHYHFVCKTCQYKAIMEVAGKS